jgi:hypothetical protein
MESMRYSKTETLGSTLDMIREIIMQRTRRGLHTLLQDSIDARRAWERMVKY